MQTRGSCGSILVIEDNADIRDALGEALETEGYNVTTAGNGEEGLAKLRGLNHPCLVLLDLMMPVMNGLEFLSACRKDDVLGSIPVVMVTAYEALALQQAKSAAAVVRKPIDLDQLLAFVKNYCGPGWLPPARRTGGAAGS